MGKLGGFLTENRKESILRSAEERVKDFQEFHPPLEDELAKTQASRCMECGIPFCHFSCPVSNVIPEFNDLVYLGKFKEALQILESTNNFPEFTGRVCPAPCEQGCVLNIHHAPVTIKEIELFIVEKGFKEGWITPQKCVTSKDKHIAVIGSGPAGLACAQELVRKGFDVTVYESSEVAGGLLRIGIPDYKLDKRIVDRRVDQLKAEGVKFILNTHVGKDIPFQEVYSKVDATVLCIGARVPREFLCIGHEVKGVYHAMEWLAQVNEKNRGVEGLKQRISVKNRDVLVIGGGDTGADCIGTSLREGAKSILQIIRKPNEKSQSEAFNEQWPFILKEFDLTTSHSESIHHFECDDIRSFETVCKEFISTETGALKQVKLKNISWEVEGEKRISREIEGSERILDIDVVFLALGFQNVDIEGLSGLHLDKVGNIVTQTAFETELEGVFVAGDARIGQSLVVSAISEGRKVAKEVEAFLSR